MRRCGRHQPVVHRSSCDVTPWQERPEQAHVPLTRSSTLVGNMIPAPIDPSVRLHLGRELAVLYDAHTSSMPLMLIEWMARFAVAEAMAKFDRSRQGHT